MAEPDPVADLADPVAVGHAGEERTAEQSSRDLLPQSEQQAVPAVDYADACRAYIEQYGAFPDAGQLAAFLAQYGVTDPATGSPLAEGAAGAGGG
ncbi:hypothetical protein OG905_01090 [Streptomyces sp. NBC_00322]|uniref:hypothetical protein n=1 Tax=Streptomyces sp. NBC_00322 TaxID=2975712 RepID=UPI002E2BEF1E|nr:hypothetical protein [Streptomyces sp. NBC_00322]